MGKGYFLKDTALVDKSNDAFHHHDYVKNMKRIIEDNEPPFNIALIGKWGVGKSSIINLLKNELQGKPEIVTHEINAWKYENESLKKAFLKNLWQTFNKEKDLSYFKLLAESLRETTINGIVDDKTSTPWQTIKSFFSVMLVFLVLFIVTSFLILGSLYLWDFINALFTNNTFSENIRGTFATFKSNIWLPIIIVPLYKILKELIKSSMQSKVADIKLVKPIETADEYEELFKEAIEDYKKRNPIFKKLVVIVDDLDRLSTKKMVAALDAIKAFVEIKECIFIVTCDENILINAIEKEKLNNSPDIDGELFLDKLFHFRIPLPPIIEYDMREFAMKIANQEVPSLVNLCNGKFEEIIDILIHPEVSTPRQVKKLLNTFSNNLLIANSREAENRKLEQQLLTGENGIKFLAKLAVIQSDYNDVYMNLGKDFNYLDDLFNFYKESGIKRTEVKSSIKILFNRTESSYKIKSEYEGLMNFLSKTQHITVDNISPFIYLAQDAIGLKAGDEKQRTIRKQLISGNEKGIISLLKDEVNPENIFRVIVEEVKNSTKKDVPSVVSAAFQLINHLMETKKELANAISYKLTTIEITHIRYWQIELSNVVEAYLSADNKIGIENALNHILDQLLWRSEKWKTPQGKEMNAEDFNIEISHLMDLLLSVHTELPESIRKKIKTFLAAEQEDFTLFPFERVLTLYKNYSQLYEEYFGFPFFNQLVDDMKKSVKNQLVEEVVIFFEISHEIRENNTEGFIDLLPSVVKSIPIENVLDTIKLLEPIFDKIEVESGTKIVEAITNKTFENKDDVAGIMALLQNIPFNIKADAEFVEQLDNFFLSHFTNDNEDNLDKIVETMEYIILTHNIGFDIFTNIFNYLIEKVITTSAYNELIMKLNRYFTDSQRTLLFNKINPPVLLGSYNQNIFNKIFNLFAILSKDQENNSYIQTVMKQGISYFQNNQWTQNSSWANDFIKLFSVVSDKLEQSDILNFVNALYNYVSPRDPSMVIKSFMNIGENIPESRATESIAYAINNSNTDSSKFDTLDFLRANKKYINKENQNLTLYANFLVENFPLHIEKFLNDLYSFFGTLSEENLLNLFLKIASLEKDALEANIVPIKNTIRKFFTAYKTDEVRGNIFYKLLKMDISFELIEILLLSSLEKNRNVKLLNSILMSENELDNAFKCKLLKLCAPYHDLLDKYGMTNLIVDILRVNDDDYIIAICGVLLDGYSDFRFNQEKRYIKSQIIPSFKQINIEAKRKLLEVVKIFKLEKEFEIAIKEKLLSDNELELVFEVLGFRKSRFK